MERKQKAAKLDVLHMAPWKEGIKIINIIPPSFFKLVYQFN